MGTMAGGGVLQIAERQIGANRCELQLDGELDLWTIDRLQLVVQRVAKENDAIIVGLDECNFVDSTGIALFLQVRRKLEDEGGRLVIYGCSDQVLRIFTVAGLTDDGMIFENREAALAQLGSGSR